MVNAAQVSVRMPVQGHAGPAHPEGQVGRRYALITFKNLKPWRSAIALHWKSMASGKWGILGQLPT